MSQTVIFRDMYGKDIQVGDWIVIARSDRGGSLYTARVAGFKKARMYITKVFETWRNTNTYTERFGECVVIPESTVPIGLQLKCEPEYSEHRKKYDV